MRKAAESEYCRTFCALFFYQTGKLLRSYAHKTFKLALEMRLVGVSDILYKFAVLPVGICKNLVQGILKSYIFAVILRSETVIFCEASVYAALGKSGVGGHFRDGYIAL